MLGRFRERYEPWPSYKLAGTAFTRDSAGNWTNPINQYFYPASGVRQTQERCWDDCHPGPPYKTGGPFEKWTHSNDVYTLKNVGEYTHGYYKYRGGFFSASALQGTLNIPQSEFAYNYDFGDVYSYGATAWNRFRPGNPAAELGVALGEAKDIPRMLQQTASSFANLWRSMGGSRKGFGPKAVANEWLNTQFGWLPFIADIMSFQKACDTIDKAMRQTRRDNNKWIRRRGVVAHDEEIEDTIYHSSVNTFHRPILVTPFYLANGYHTGSHKVRIKNEQLAWFSAKFKYYIPDIGSIDWKNRFKRAYFGIHMSPSLLYELLPWSWLVDWFSNAGDVISNLSDPIADNLVAQYAYIMGTTRRIVEVASRHNIDGKNHDATWVAFCERKSRQHAEPFGFGLTGGTLSPRRSSILAALGISRLR